MASIKQRKGKKNIFDITVSHGYNSEGKKMRYYKTIILDENLTEKQQKKELDRQADKFEEEVKSGRHYDDQITFKALVELWKAEYASQQLQPKTLHRYEGLLKRVIPAIGHIKLCELQPMNLIKFYKMLQNSVSEKAIYAAKPTLKVYLEEKGIDENKVAEISKLSPRTITQVINGKNTNKAKEICSALNVPLKSYFIRVDSKKTLDNRTVLHHHRLISSILSCAVHWQIVESNCATRIKPPKVEKSEPVHFDEDTVNIVLELLESEQIKYKAMIYVALFSGCRLGELSGLEWNNVDFNNNTIKIAQASQYLPEKGVFIKTTKNQSSQREVTMPAIAMKVLEQYKVWQNEQRLLLGDKWEDNKECEDSEPRYFVFTQWNGKPIFPNTPSNWFRMFRKKNNLPDVVFHGLRHSNASILISEHVDVQTVASRLGHAKATTTTTIYSHFLKKPDKEAANKLDKLFDKDYKEKQS